VSAWLGRGSLRTGFMILERSREFRARERDRRVKRQGLRESFQMLRDAHRWGNAVGEAPEVSRALWIRLSAAPAIAPYAAPSTWGETLATSREGRDRREDDAGGAAVEPARWESASGARRVFDRGTGRGGSSANVLAALRLHPWRLYCPGVSAGSEGCRSESHYTPPSNHSGAAEYKDSNAGELAVIR